MKTELSEGAAQLLSFPKVGDGIGLHRMMFFRDALPSQAWIQKLDAIRVTGSKGKGSVSAMIAEILRRLQIKTGLFTSPHLVAFEERIKVDGVNISDGDLARAAGWVAGLRDRFEEANPGDRVAAFEAFTSAAMYHFCREQVAAVVSEVGIGGRYDSTRVLPGQVVALTSLELEHTHILGSSLPVIGYDKADLCPGGGTLFVGLIESDVLRRLRGYCRVRGVQVVAATEQASISNVRYASGVMTFDMSCDGLVFDDLAMRLLGDHQARNAAVAVLTARHWLALNRPDVSDETFKAAVRSGLNSVEWPGRFQRIWNRPEVIIDVGHTPQSLRSVAETIRRTHPTERVLLVTGASEDKDIAGILAEIVPASSAVVCTRAYRKGAPVSAIEAHCERLKPGIVWRTAGNIEEAMELALARAVAEDMVVVVAGGLFLSVEAMVYLQGGDPRQLTFF